MSERKDGGPAFAHGNSEQGGHPGMSLLDWFAGQALASGDAVETSCKHGADFLARQAYEIADAMLAQREKDSE